MMELDITIAQNIVKRTHKIIQYSINVMDDNGIIIASCNPKRLKHRHTAAILALRNNQTIEVDANLSKKWNYKSLPGINMPITYLGKTLGVVGISGNPNDVRPYAELVKMTAELIVEQSAQLERERWQRRYKEEFMLQLVSQENAHQHLQQQAEFFGFDLNTTRSILLIKLLKPTPSSLEELVHHLEQQEFDVAIISLDQIMIFYPINQMPISVEKLHKFLPPEHRIQDYKIALDDENHQANSFYLSYQCAQYVLQYGMLHFPQKNFYTFSKYKLQTILHSFTHHWFSRELTKPLEQLAKQDEKKQLRKTLQQYFLSNCDRDLTSQRLFIHPNTLRYRLDKIEQITGLSFNKISDKLLLYLAILQYH